VENITFRAFWKDGSFNLEAEAEAEEVWLDKNFLTNDNFANDWSIIKLKKPMGSNRHIGEEIGWLGYKSHPNINAYEHQSLSTVHVKRNGRFLLSTGKIIKSTPNIVDVDLDALPGISGAPVFTEDNCAIALFEGVENSNNVAMLIILELFNVIAHIKDK
jgi:V8-like Glu-specific endopeptidase